jgi:hypothetical protein
MSENLHLAKTKVVKVVTIVIFTILIAYKKLNAGNTEYIKTKVTLSKPIEI